LHNSGGRTLAQRLNNSSRSTHRRPESRLAHLARFEHALELARVADLKVDAAAPLRELDALEREPYDFVVCAGKMLKASVLWKQGSSADADALMRSTLAEWQARQRSATHFPPSTDLERDVVAIRDAVFKPMGGAPFGAAPLNQLKPLYMVVGSELRVTSADHTTVTLTTVQPLPGFENVLFATTEQFDLLRKIARRVGRHDLEGPIIQATMLSTWWNTFFQATHGAWGSFDVETYPIISGIEFLDEKRSKAATAVFTSGSQGATVILEKEDGRWKA